MIQLFIIMTNKSSASGCNVNLVVSLACILQAHTMPNTLKTKLPPLELSESIGHRIARLRKERGYTQKELGEKIGIMHSLVSDYERQRLKMNAEMVVRFALALEVSADEILGLKTNHRQTNPSLRIVRRLKRIETLPPSKQKSLLQIIDGFLKGEGKSSR